MNQEKIGQFLKELRKEKKMTQAQLAEMLNVSNRSVSRWENGVLILGIIYTSGYMAKIRAFKMRLLKHNHL